MILFYYSAIKNNCLIIVVNDLVTDCLPTLTVWQIKNHSISNFALLWISHNTKLFLLLFFPPAKCTLRLGCAKPSSAPYQRKFTKNPSKRSPGSLSVSWLSERTPLWCASRTTLICVYPQLPGRMPWDLCTRSLAPSLQGNCSFYRYSSTYLSSEMLSEIH